MHSHPRSPHSLSRTLQYGAERQLPPPADPLPLPLKHQHIMNIFEETRDHLVRHLGLYLAKVVGLSDRTGDISLSECLDGSCIAKSFCYFS